MNILVVDDEPGLRHTLTLILEGEGHRVASAADGRLALEHLAAHADVDLVLSDLRMPVLDGMALLAAHRERGGRALVVAMSAYGDDAQAIAAMQAGAYDYIPKPFRADQVILVVRKAEERERLRTQVDRLREEVEALRGGADGGIVGRSRALHDVLAVARKAARHPTTVLVTGESGTGKELVARFLHQHSPRAAAPFVAVNCGAIPESLIESELFGHARGAFTGATTERRGLFEEASGGTIFLDEVGELPPAMQVRLLRVLQEGEVRRVGADASRAVDVRVVAATARDVEAAVQGGQLRPDLYYRLNVVRLHLPPLRERPEDLAELARHFADVHGRRLGLRVRGFTPGAMRRLAEHRWPGNVRELENVVERALVLADGPEIGVDELRLVLPGEGATPAPTPGAAALPDDADLSVKRQTERLERALIGRALEHTGGNRTRAAQLLELSHRALLYKIREYRLDG